MVATPGISTGYWKPEHALGGALVWRHRQQVFALKQDSRAGDLVTRLAKRQVLKLRKADSAKEAVSWFDKTDDLLKRVEEAERMQFEGK